MQSYSHLINCPMNNKYLVLAAQAISLLFSPFYLPVIAFVALFVFSYLNMLPLTYKVVLLGGVYLFTVLIPRLAIFLYRKLNGWSRHELGHREKRYVPYVLSITSYAMLLYLMDSLHMPHFTLGIIAGALAIQIVCSLINRWIKVSTHSAAAGGVVGALMAFSVIFSFDPTAWLCLTIILAGLVSTSRLILRQHTLPELGAGVLVGVVCGFLCILLV